MNPNEQITIARDCEAALVPSGDRVTLKKGETAHITQSLGGSYTVVIQGNMFRINGKDADALGKEVLKSSVTKDAEKERTQEELQKVIWDQMKTCFDPEIPVNVVDLGLIYDCRITRMPKSGNVRADIKMTLTAPGCGMGEYLKSDVEGKVLEVEEVTDCHVELVWEPQWNQGMMTEAAKLQLGMV